MASMERSGGSKKPFRFIEVYVEIDISKQFAVGLMGSFASF